MAHEFSERLLVVVHEVKALSADWDAVRAAALAERYPDLGKPQRGETASDVAKVSIFVCQLLTRLGDFVEVERRYRTALATVRGDADPETVIEYLALAGIALAQGSLGERQEAARTSMEALEFARRHSKERGGCSSSKP